MTRAHLLAEAKDKDKLADWLAGRNPVMLRRQIRELRILASQLRSRAMELEQKEAA